MAYVMSTFLLMTALLMPPDREARNFRLRTLDGERITLSQFHGQVLLMHFWATWSTASQTPLKRLEALQAKYLARGFRVLAVSVDDRAKQAGDFVRQHQIGLQVAHDRKGRVAASYRVETIPSTFLIDRDGRIRVIYRGRLQDSFADMVRQVEKLLDEQSTTKNKKLTSSFANLVLGDWP